MVEIENESPAPFVAALVVRGASAVDLADATAFVDGRSALRTPRPPVAVGAGRRTARTEDDRDQRRGARTRRSRPAVTAGRASWPRSSTRSRTAPRSAPRSRSGTRGLGAIEPASAARRRRGGAGLDRSARPGDAGRAARRRPAARGRRPRGRRRCSRARRGRSTRGRRGARGLGPRRRGGAGVGPAHRSGAPPARHGARRRHRRRGPTVRARVADPTPRCSRGLRAVLVRETDDADRAARRLADRVDRVADRGARRADPTRSGVVLGAVARRATGAALGGARRRAQLTRARARSRLVDDRAAGRGAARAGPDDAVTSGVGASGGSGAPTGGAAPTRRTPRRDCAGEVDDVTRERRAVGLDSVDRRSASGERLNTRTTSAPASSRSTAETSAPSTRSALTGRRGVGARPTAAAHPLERHEELVGGGGQLGVVPVAAVGEHRVVEREAALELRALERVERAGRVRAQRRARSGRGSRWRAAA